MKIIKRIGLSLLVLVVLFGIAGLFIPAQQHLERSIIINTNQETAFNTLNSFKEFNKWSPWHKLDPQTEYTQTGPESGVGASMTWKSDKREVGSGSQEIVESTPYSTIKVKLEFGTDISDSTYQLSSVSDGVEVTWGFDADFGYNIPGRYFGLMLESLLGPSYEEGLANLKTHLEAKNQ